MKATMKTIFATIGVLLFAVSISTAQPQRGEHPRELPNEKQIEKMIDHLAIDLSLSEDQKTKISALYIAHFDELKVKRGEEEAKREKLKNSHDNFRDEFYSSVKAELDAEQAKEFDALNEKRRDNRGKRDNERDRRRG